MCINTSVYVYTYLCIYTHKYVFAVQVIKMGEGFCVFLIGEEILKTRNCNSLNFKLKKKIEKFKIVRLWKMDPHFCSHFESQVHL